MSFHVPPAPFATFYSSQTQAVADATAAQAITFDITGVAKGIALAGGTKITLTQIGNYALSFSAIGSNSGSSSTRVMNIFLKKNGNAVASSSSIVTLSKQIPITVVATFDIPCTTSGDYYELFLAGSDTDVELLATAANATSWTGCPNMPACPSIIVAAWQIN